MERRNSPAVFDQIMVTISPVSSFSFFDPSLIYVFLRISDNDPLVSLVKSRKPQAFYQIDGKLYAQVAVYSSSRAGKRALDACLDSLVEQGLDPIALEPAQVISIAKAVG